MSSDNAGATNKPFFDHGEIERIEREDCWRSLRDDHADAVCRLADRVAALGRPLRDVAILVLCADDPVGGQLAGALMPGYDWSSIRDTGKTPYARAIVVRSGIQKLLDGHDPERADQLRAIDEVAVIMVDRGVILVCSASDVRRQQDAVPGRRS